MKQQQDPQTQKERQQFVLNKALLSLACLLFFFASYIANYHATINEAWANWKYIIYFSFILMFFSLRNEVLRLLTPLGYRVVIYLLINYFIDEYLGLKSWSWNDFVTITILIIEFIIKYYANNTYKRSL